MKKDQFFNLSVEQRKALIKEAHKYYEEGFQEDLSKVKEPEVRDFIQMCIAERNQALLEEVSLV